MNIKLMNSSISFPSLQNLNYLLIQQNNQFVGSIEKLSTRSSRFKKFINLKNAPPDNFKPPKPRDPIRPIPNLSGNKILYSSLKRNYIINSYNNQSEVYNGNLRPYANFNLYM